MYLNKWPICRKKRICLKAMNDFTWRNRIIPLCLIIYSLILQHVAEEVLSVLKHRIINTYAEVEVRLHIFLTSTIWRVVISLKPLAVWVGRNRLGAEAKKGKIPRKSLSSQGLKPVVHKICELHYKLHILCFLHSIPIEVTVARTRHYLLQQMPRSGFTAKRRHAVPGRM
jgi:hypothetical protein